MNTKTKERALFALGVAICAGVAGISVLLEHLIPGGLLGASIIALFMGTIINSFFHPAWIKPALKFVSKKILKVAIILLSASLSVGTIMSVGKMTFFVMIFTFAMCFGGGYFVRKIFKLNWKLGNLISAGTGFAAARRWRRSVLERASQTLKRQDLPRCSTVSPLIRLSL